MGFNLALVTGASSGIGYALCQLLADQKINLIISGRNEKKLDELKAQLISKVDVQTIPCDLRNDNQKLRLFAAIKEKAPDLVINNAGIGLYLDALDYETDKQVDILKVNGLSLLEITLESAKAMRLAHKEGVILNVSSVAAFFPFPYFSTYAATKAFVNKLSENLDYEFKDKGIRVLAACPGVVNTAFRERAGGSAALDESHAMTAEFAANQILKQIINRKTLHIFDFKYKIAVILSHFLPKFVIAKLLMNKITQRVK